MLVPGAAPLAPLNGALKCSFRVLKYCEWVEVKRVKKKTITNPRLLVVLMMNQKNQTV